MYFVIDELISIIQKNIKEPYKSKVFSNKDNNNNTNSPIILVYDNGFVFEEIGLGSNYGDFREEKTEKFSCDGSNRKYQLSRLPIRPLLEIENPKGNKKMEYQDFKVNYNSGMLLFHSPPEKGKDNLIVKYFTKERAGEAKGLRLQIRCHIDCIAKSPKECDEITLEIIKAFVMSSEALAQNEINLRAIECTNISDGARGGSRSKEGTKDKEKEKEVFGRRLIYQAETNIKVETKVPVIEDIQIRMDKE